MRNIEMENELKDLLEKHTKGVQEVLDILDYASAEFDIPIENQLTFWVDFIKTLEEIEYQFSKSINRGE